MTSRYHQELVFVFFFFILIHLIPVLACAVASQCCFPFPPFPTWDDSPQVDSRLFQIPNPDQKINSKPAILQCSTYAWRFTAKNPRISALPIYISLQISPVPSPAVFKTAVLRPQAVPRMCHKDPLDPGDPGVHQAPCGMLEAGEGHGRKIWGGQSPSPRLEVSQHLQQTQRRKWTR